MIPNVEARFRVLKREQVYSIGYYRYYNYPTPWGENSGTHLNTFQFVFPVSKHAQCMTLIVFTVLLTYPP